MNKRLFSKIAMVLTAFTVTASLALAQSGVDPGKAPEPQRIYSPYVQRTVTDSSFVLASFMRRARHVQSLKFAAPTIRSAFAFLRIFSRMVTARPFSPARARYPAATRFQSPFPSSVSRSARADRRMVNVADSLCL